MSDTVVVIGAGQAAGQAVASLRQKQFVGRIIVLGEEDYYPYQRPPLSKKFLAGALSVERLYLKPPNFYADKKIDVHLNTRVTHIDPQHNVVTDSHGNTHRYDRLIIATGARVRRLDIAGSDLADIHYLRNISDVSAMQEHMSTGKSLVIIGGGYIGLEVAAVAAAKGLNVTVVEMADRVMGRVVCEQISEFYQTEHIGHGVKLLLSTGLESFSGDEYVRRVHLSNGLSIPTDFVLVGIGVVPNVELATDAGIDVDNGIRVNDRCQTNIESVYAIGDCTNHPNSLLNQRLRLESVQNAIEQAKVAASNICGEDARYAEVPWFWSDQYDLKLQIAGISHSDDRAVLRGDPATRSFSCVYLRNGRIVAINSINSPRDFMQSKSLISAHALMDLDKLCDKNVILKDAVHSSEDSK